MLIKHNPSSIRAARYVHGIEVPAGARWLHLSGQVGIDPDGTIAADVVTQMKRAWLNVFAILESAGMSPRDIVKITIYLTQREHVQAYREVRDRMFGEAEPASTVVLVPGFGRADLLVEIDVIAAGA